MSAFAAAAAAREVEASIRRLYTWAAWADKYDGAVHHTPFRMVTLAMPEPLGVMGVVQFNPVAMNLIVPKHIWSAIAKPDTDINKTPVGSGPYTLKSFTPQTTTLTVRADASSAPRLGDTVEVWLDPKAIHVVRPEIPVGLSEIVQTCMKKDREQRYPIEHLDPLRESGISGMFLPKAYGGGGASLVSLVAVPIMLFTVSPLCSRR